MLIKRALVAYNPKSGRFSEGKLLYILDFLKNQSIKPETLDITEKKLDKIYASNFDVIIVAGGDGTLNCVINSLVFTDTPIAHLPLGTVNLFAIENKTPFRLEKALNDIIYKYEPLKVNLGKAGDKYFIGMAGIGLDAFIVKKVEEKIDKFSVNRRFFNNFFKYLSYIINIIKISRRFKFHGIAIEAETDPVCDVALTENDSEIKNYSLDLSYENNNAKNKYFANQVIISNIRYYAGPFKIFPDNSPLMDKFHVRIVNNVSSRLDIMVSILKSLVFYKSYCKNPDKYLRSDEVVIYSVDPDCNNDIYYQLDGEFSGTLPVVIKKVKNAITMLVNMDSIISQN